MRLTLFKAAALGLAAAAMPVTALAQDADADAQAEALRMIEEAIPGTLLHNPLEMKWRPGGGDMKTKVVPAADLTTGEAIQVKNKTRRRNAWDAHLQGDVTEAISAGDKIQVLYYVRTEKASKGRDKANMVMFLGRNVEPYDSVLIHEFEPSTEWEMQSVTGTATDDFPAGKTKIEYQLGKAAQTVEFGPIYISKLD